MPVDSTEPRSASLVTTAGLMSTQMSRTPAGVMFPTPIEWSMEESMRIMSAPSMSRAYSACAAIRSTSVSGSGPSSRIEPASAKGTPWRTLSYMTPLRTTPAPTACRPPPELADQAAGDARLAGGAVDDQYGVHPLPGRAHPPPAHPHVGREDARAVEVVGRDPLLLDRRETRVVLVLGDPRARLDEPREDRVQALGRRRHHPHARERGLVVAEAGLEGLDLEVAPAVGDAVEHGVHEARVEQVALDLDRALAHLGGDPRGARGPPRARVLELEDQALGGAARQDELPERADDDLVAPARQALAERVAREVRDHRAAGHDRVARTVEGVGRVHLAALLGRHARGDAVERVAVEGVGVVEEAALGERAETGVEVVEALVDQAQRHDLDVHHLRQVAVRLERGTHAVAAPEERRSRLEERVALALERPPARELDDAAAAAAKPLDGVARLGRALGEAEACGHEGVVVHEPRVGGEGHVGEARRGLEQLQVGARGERRAECLPLPHRLLGVGAADVPLHPRVDDVLDAVEARRAEEEGVARRHPDHYSARARQAQPGHSL